MSRTVPPEWVRGPADELAIGQGCYFDAEAAEFPIAFVERFCKQSKGRWAGEPIGLLDWQRDFVARLFGWKLPDGRRRYRSAYLEVAKKNGKSTLLSALVLYLLLADGEGAPEVYLNACDKEQASIIFDEACRMVRASPDLMARLEIVNSRADKRIVDPRGNGKVVTNSADVDSKDGVNASAVVFDELHRQPGRGLWDIMEYAGVSRRQPLRIAITTAGEDPEGVWHEQREKSDAVNAGADEDVSHLGVVYRALPGDDVDDPATWRKANPSLGVTIDPEDFARELADARKSPARWANFCRLRLNIVMREEVKFLRIEAWDACERPAPKSPPRGKGYGGLDLSSVNDLTAAAWVVGDLAGGVDVTMRYWLPGDDIVELERKHKVPYRAWADRGLITLTEGAVIDYAFIRSEVNELAAELGCERLLVDPFNATDLAIRLRDADGLAVEFLRQGFLSLSAPTKELERLVLAGRLRHDPDPILKWMVMNAVVVRDDADNVKLSKKRSRKKIDGLSALVNALAGLLAAAGDDDGGESVYDRRGLLFL